jgi:quercetin dioxygenase-like cupin family protein
MAGLKMASRVKGKTGEKLGAGAVKLADLADYHEGSIVSRTIIDKKTGTITFFAFDEEQGLSEHAAPYDALVYILDGEAEVVISGKTNHLREGEMILIPANKPHALKATRRCKMMLIMIKA